MRACSVAAVVATATPGHGAPPPTPVYTVSAARSGSVDVTWSRAVTLELRNTTVVSGRTYSGYYVQPLAAPADSGTGELRVTQFHQAPFAPARVPLGDRQGSAAFLSQKMERVFVPGRYRIHVFGDGATTVRLALRGAGVSRALGAKRRSVVVAAVRDLTPRLVEGQAALGVSTGGFPVTVPSPHSMTVAAVYFTFRSAYPAFTGTYNVCLGPPENGAPCHAGPKLSDDPYHENTYDMRDYRISHPVPLLSGAVTYAGYYTGGTAVAGDRTASYALAVDALIDKVVVAAFSLAY